MAEAAGRTQSVLRQDGEVGVVLNEDGPAGQFATDQLVPVDPLGLRQVGGEAEPAVTVDHAGGADADRRGDGLRPGQRPKRMPDAGRTAGDRPVEVGHHLGHRLGDVAADDVPGAPRGGDPGLGDDGVGAVQGDAEDLGPADVDAVGDAGVRRAAVRGHEVDSTRAFSSRMAVAMMRLVARILMKPGMGTRSSASRWYVTSVPPPSPGSKM